MKIRILAPLCSALVIPGLGQILNQEIRKGVLILGAVFVLFVAASAKLLFILKSLVSQSGTVPSGFQILNQPDLFLILGAFVVVWIYSIVDAFLGARNRMEQSQEEER